MKKTKIVCTLGPSTDDREILKKMILGGMDVARFNFSHQDHAAHGRRAELVRSLARELGAPVALLLDTRGPEIRLGRFKNKSAELKEGQTFTLTAQEVEGNGQRVRVSYKKLPEEIGRGTRILLDDGLIELRVDRTTADEIICTVQNGGKISDLKSVNIPDVKLSLPFISEQDKSDLVFGIEQGFDFVAASFTRSAGDIVGIRSLLEKNGGGDIKLIAKIENAQGVENIDGILKVSDGIMIARGDMGVEIPFEDIPSIQKMLIRKANAAGKVIITATQMLDSMVKNPRPTRAEITDVANAIYDGTSALMLSAETAVGLYPVEAVKTMSRIAQRTEADINYVKRLHAREPEATQSVPGAISHATCTTAHELGAAAIVSVTKSGQTARFISKFRPACPIFGCTPDEKVYRQLSLSWGVIPLITKEHENTDDLLEHSVCTAKESGFLKTGDLVVITAGVPLGVSGSTNLLKVYIVGDVLVSGQGIVKESVSGTLCVASTEEEAFALFKDGDILVLPETSNSLMSIIKKSSGIIAEQEGETSHAAVAGLTLDIPVIVGVKNATKILKSGTFVTLDGEKGFVYNCGKSGGEI
jgi:pyruvate kinase